jgi:hypothetical protein
VLKKITRVSEDEVEEEWKGIASRHNEDPVSWHISVAYLPLKNLLTLSEDGFESALMRRGTTYYAKIGGAGGVQENS